MKEKQQEISEVRLDTDDFAQGTFKPHGRSKIRSIGEIFSITTEGPFNLEAVEAVNRTRVALLESKPPTHAYVYINVFSNSVLMSPEALAAYQAGLQQAYGGSYLPPSAMAWVFPEGVEGGAIMKPLYEKLFAAVGIAFQIFQTAEAAQVWVQQVLDSEVQPDTR